MPVSEDARMRGYKGRLDVSTWAGCEERLETRRDETRRNEARRGRPRDNKMTKQDQGQDGATRTDG